MIKANGEEIKVTVFPDKTSQVWKLSPSLLKAQEFKVVWDFESEGELLHLAQLKAILDLRKPKVSLEISYLPYGRQDKEVSNESTFALRPFAQLLNALHFERVEITDPHSALALELIDHAHAKYPTLLVNQVIKLTETDVLCYPDKGARTRYSKIYEAPSIWGEKVRDQLTGEIISYELNGDPRGKKILIIDDICDGGATFIHLAKALVSQGATSVNLFVTHGLFTKGLGVLLKAGIKNIYCQKGKALEANNIIHFEEI